MRVHDSHIEYPVRTIIVMGVSGCGKSTIGTQLARKLDNAPFIDADTLHPPQNKQKMSQGSALEDKDRWPWLERVRNEIQSAVNNQVTGNTRQYVVCGCSALKRSYREFLSANTNTHDTVFVYVDVSKQELERRLSQRQGHFFNSRLLDSQLETLEVPDCTRETAISIYGDGDEREVVDNAYTRVIQYVS